MLKATFLMSAYNSRNTIAEAVQSVLKQSYKEFRLIIVDDASTDDTPDIISKFHDSRIHLIRNETNLYIPDSANKGLEHVDTPYLLRFDSDDICLPNRLEKQLDFMDKNPEVGVCGSYVYFFGFNNARWIMPSNDNDIKAYMLFNNGFANSSVIIRMEVLNKHKLNYSNRYLYPPMEDYDLWYRMLPFTCFSNIPEILVKKRWHSESMSSVYASQAWHKLNDFFEEHLPALGIHLNPRDREIHTHFSTNLKGEYLNAKPADYAVYLRKLMTVSSKNSLFDPVAVEKICIKKWMLLAENIRIRKIDKVNEHLRLTKELFGKKMGFYFLKKKIRQLLPV